MTAEPEKPARRDDRAENNPIWRSASAAIDALIRVMPGPVRRRLQTEAGTRFTRFLPVALASLLTSQIMLAILTGFNMTAGKAALAASVVGAGVSYVLSRWAWERKGRPDLLRETVPFWLVSFAVWGILALVTHYAGSYAKQHDLHHLEKHLVIQGTYLAANCITFVTRFLIFHYVLFKNREPVVGPELKPAEPPARTPADGHGEPVDGHEEPVDGHEEPAEMALTAEATDRRQAKS